MSTQQLTAHVPSEVYEEVNTEAKEAGTSTHDYVKNIIIQRKGKSIQLANADAAIFQGRLEGRIEALKEQLLEANQRIQSLSEKSSLNGVEQQQKSVTDQIQEALDKRDNEYTLKELRQKVKDLEEELEETEQERDKYKAVVESNDKLQKIFDGVSQGLTAVSAAAPKQVERMMNGLTGLLGMGGPAEIGSFDEGQTLALQFGNAILKDIPEEMRMAVLDVLKFISVVPNGLQIIQNLKPYKAWQQSQG